MSGFLDNLEDLDSIKWLIEEVINIINYIDMSEIFKDLNKGLQKDLFGEYLHKDPYLHLYEDFLASYDPKLRELRGVYYTPAPVVEFIIDAIDVLLQKDFKKAGLKAAIHDTSITLLDFATGTGTFLLQAFNKALESTPKNSAKYDPKALIKRFHGFEYLITPYVIAHLRISEAFKNMNQKLEENESLSIRLTNTLYSSSITDEKTKKSTLENAYAGAVELAEEFEKAQSIKDSPNILIITGNPPYSGASANKGYYEDEVRISYGLEPSLAELSENEQKHIAIYLKRQPKNRDKQLISTFKSILDRHKLQNEKNPKWLLDDYVKFICFAERKIKHQGGGIFAFISNNGFLDNPTFRGMRYHLLNTFDKIYILDLHGSMRKKESTPNNEKDENVFDIKQGVSINIFVKATKNAKNLATIYHYDVYGKRKDKYTFLKESTLDSIAWQALKPQAPFYLFIPQDENLRAEYDKGFSVKDIFKVSSVGVVTGKDSVFIAPNIEALESQVRNFCNEFEIQFVKDIAYRPFDMRKVYYDVSKIERARIDIMQHFLEDFENKALLVSRQGSAVGDDEINTIAITDKIVDINFYRRGGEQVMPLYIKNPHANGGNTQSISHAKTNEVKKYKKSAKKLKDSKVSLESSASKSSLQASASLNGNLPNTSDTDSKGDILASGQWVENFTPEFREFIDSKYNEHFSPEQILGYIYAVLFHKEYREKYLDFLKIDFPKIPFVESKELFLEFSTLGQELIRVHLMADNERERERQGGAKMNLNIGLNIARQYKMSGSWQCVLAVNTIADFCLMGGGNTGAGVIFPLYLYQKAQV